MLNAHQNLYGIYRNTLQMEKLNSRIKEIRISTELKDLLDKTLNSLNSNSECLQFKESDLVRMSLKHFCNLVLQEGLTLNLLLKK